MPSRGWLHGVLAAAVVGLLLVRLAAIEADPPGGIVSYSGALMGDEGFYLKAARLYHAFGVWRNEADSNWYYLSPLYAAVTTGLGFVARDLLAAARYLSVLCSVASVAVFYRICRHRLAVGASLACCLLVAASFDAFAYSRVAFAEPLGTLLGLMALWLWVAWRRRLAWCVASLACAFLAVCTKSNLAYTLGAALLLWAWEAWRAFRRGERRTALGIAAAGACALAAVAGMRVALARVAVEDAASLDSVMKTQFRTVSLEGVLRNEWGLLAWHARRPWRLALVAGMAPGALAWVACRVRRRPAAAQAGSEPWRPLAALGVWAGVGLLFFGWFDYQPPRWVSFSVYPAAYAAVASLVFTLAARGGRRTAAVAALVLAHVVLQVPALQRYALRADSGSLLRAMRDVARRVADGGREVRLLGSLAHMAALCSRTIRPLSSSHDHEGELPERLARWRPAYVLGYSRELDRLHRTCSHLVQGYEVLARYTIMANYYEGRDLALVRLVYRDGGPPLLQRTPQDGL